VTLGVEVKWSAANSRVELAWPIPQVQPAWLSKDPNLLVVAGPERIYPIDGSSFFRLAGGGLSRLDGNGRVLWTAALPLSSPVLELLPAPEGNAFVLERGGTLLAVDNEGGLAWRLRLPSGGDQPRMALGAAGELFVTTGEQLWSITPQGEVAWVFPAPHPVVVPPAPAATGGVYLGTEQAVFSLSPAGAVRWSRPVPVTSPGMVPERDGTLRVYTSRGATIFAAGGREVADLDLSMDGFLSGRLGESWPENKYVSLQRWLKGAEGQTYVLDSRHRRALLALDVAGLSRPVGNPVRPGPGGAGTPETAPGL